MPTAGHPAPDPRTHAWRKDLAAAELAGQVDADRYVEGDAARVAVPVAAVRRKPDATAGLDTEALYGERVRVLDVADDWAWVQLERDRYVGYVEVRSIAVDMPEPTHRVQALGTFIYPVPDIKVPPLHHLPMGAAIALKAQDERFAEIETGGFVILRHIREMEGRARDFVDVAERFIGTPYLWGGRTRLGLDCSGLLQIALDAAGVNAPRDTDMQEAALGTSVLVPQDLEGLERGDLVFWPGHVGIMVDGVMLLHANAHHMSVAVEPLRTAAERTRAAGSRITSVKRLPAFAAVPPVVRPAAS